MTLSSHRLLLGIVLMLSAAWVQASLPPGIAVGYTASDDVDLVTGQDLWQYDYYLTGSLGEFETLELLFDPTLYKNLTIVKDLDATVWSSYVAQPLASVPADGVFNALATKGLPAIQASFTVQFVWLGAGEPGVQPFTIYDSLFSQTGTGVTEPAPPPVPVPGALVLFISGLALLGRPSFFKASLLAIKV